MDSLPQWSSAERFNRLVAAPAHHYVILLPFTDSFDVEKDLKHFLDITKKPLIWFAEKFRKHGIRVEYGTVFCQRDARQIGPLATNASYGIVRCRMQSAYSNSVVFVCAPHVAKQLPFETINPETLVRRILEQ